MSTSRRSTRNWINECRQEWMLGRKINGKKEKRVWGCWELEEREGVKNTGGKTQPGAGTHGGPSPSGPGSKAPPLPAAVPAPGKGCIRRSRWLSWVLPCRPSVGSETPVAAWESLGWSPVPRWLWAQTFLPIFSPRNEKRETFRLAPLPSPSIIISGDFLGNTPLSGRGVP